VAKEYTQIRNIVEIMKKKKTGKERTERKGNNTKKVCLQKERAKPE